MRRIILPVMLALTAILAGCATYDPIRLEVAGPPVPAQETRQQHIYVMPRSAQSADDGGLVAQGWSMLGREDRAAQLGQSEYVPVACGAIAGSSIGREAALDAIAARAAHHRIVIINESHVVTRHRDMTRGLLAKLHPLGFRVLAAETFYNPPAGDEAPVVRNAALPWPHRNDGTYSLDAAFGRLLRQAKALEYRLYPYEEVEDDVASAADIAPEDWPARIARRETAQARNLAAILAAMAPDERLLVHVGYSHALEVPRTEPDGITATYMAALLKQMTGLDPLTISQTNCRGEGPATMLVNAPAHLPPGAFDMLISHPLDRFIDHRPQWRREAGDRPVAIPPALRPTDAPLVIEAFGWDEPFDAVPFDRVLVEPGEDVPLLLPPGRYRVRAVRMADRQ